MNWLQTVACPGVAPFTNNVAAGTDATPTESTDRTSTLYGVEGESPDNDAVD
jgi:hypothetical protein